MDVFKFSVASKNVVPPIVVLEKDFSSKESNGSSEQGSKKWLYPKRTGLGMTTISPDDLTSFADLEKMSWGSDEDAVVVLGVSKKCRNAL